MKKTVYLVTLLIIVALSLSACKPLTPATQQPPANTPEQQPAVSPPEISQPKTSYLTVTSVPQGATIPLAAGSRKQELDYAAFLPTS